MLAYYLHSLDPIIFRIYDNVGPRWYGLAYVLAFICGYLVFLWLAKRGYADLPPQRVGDFITGCALFGVIIGGRLGYVFFYKPEVATALRSILSARHPSQLYEAFFEGIVLFAILWFVRTRTRQPNGVLTGLFFICYAIFRIVIENFREPDAELIGAFTRGQFFSFFLIAIGIAFVVGAKRRPTFPRKTPVK